jgi:hypothetical protein
LLHEPGAALLRALYLQAVAPAHAAVQDDLQQVARDSQQQLGKWAGRAALDRVRRRVLARPQEPLPPSPVRPEAWAAVDPAPLDQAIQALWARIDAVHADLRLWNSLTPPGWKLRVWPERFPTLQTFQKAPRTGLEGLLRQLGQHSAQGALLRME